MFYVCDDDYFQISGLQHFCFCRRQWALIHIEQQWAENFRTTDGEILHHNAHDGDPYESRSDCIITRGLRVHSPTLGVSGICDILEFHRNQDGITIAGKEGLWQPYPVEYKRGEPSSHTAADSMQLCAQAICLEEMLCCSIPKGALYYGETRHRLPVEFTTELREQVQAILSEMRNLYRRGYTPKVKPTKACNACSLREICLPKLHRTPVASEYIRSHLEEET